LFNPNSEGGKERMRKWKLQRDYEYAVVDEVIVFEQLNQWEWEVVEYGELAGFAHARQWHRPGVSDAWYFLRTMIR
jgi:hypothetical protein